ncbi:hypothetical protein BZA77DRAFT_297507 [Pyronema omphalodes]|nr:hypothetical protein BZA77DRAFT_297507 [Pyronema omphalodes]
MPPTRPFCQPPSSNKKLTDFFKPKSNTAPVDAACPAPPSSTSTSSIFAQSSRPLPNPPLTSRTNYPISPQKPPSKPPASLQAILSSKRDKKEKAKADKAKTESDDLDIDLMDAVAVKPHNSNPSPASAQLKREYLASTTKNSATHSPLSQTSSLSSLSPCPSSESDSMLSSVPSAPAPAKSKLRVVPASDGEESDDSLDDPFPSLTQARSSSFNSGSGKTTTAAPRKLSVPSRPLKRGLDDDLFLTKPVKAKTPANSKYKFSVTDILEDKRNEVDMSAELERARRMVEESERSTLPSDGVQKFLEGNGTQEIGASVGDEGVEGLLKLIGKNGGRNMRTTWGFFEKTSGRARRQFPVNAVKGEVWQAIRQEQSRRDMFLRATVRDFEMFGELLPQEVVMWMLDQVCFERNDDLALAYYYTLKARVKIRPDILSLAKIKELLENLGAKSDALELEKPMTANTLHDPLAKTRVIDFWNIQLLIRLFGYVTDGPDENRIKYMSILLLRIALDHNISQKGDVVKRIGISLSKILGRIPDNQWGQQSREIGAMIISTVVEPQLRARILRVLPVWSERLHEFRRRLACAFVFGDDEYLSKPYADLMDLNRIAELLNGPLFSVSRDADFSVLQALFAIVDVAIGDGATDGDQAQKNRQADIVCDMLRNMFTRIIDTNARDLTKTETKDAIDRLRFRLSFAVRSKLKTMFDQDGIQGSLPDSWLTSASR